jgi:hypothetical protein
MQTAGQHEITGVANSHTLNVPFPVLQADLSTWTAARLLDQTKARSHYQCALRLLFWISCEAKPDLAYQLNSSFPR